MPTYEYRCDACGHRFERLQRFSDDPVRTCPDCGEDEVQRLISAGAGLVFKGSGFYATDYKKSPQKKAESSEGPGKKEDAGSGDEGKRESGTSKGPDGSSGREAGGGE